MTKNCKPREKCAVVGVVSKSNANTITIEALRALQHRGQEASGVVSQIDSYGSLAKHREAGLVKDVYMDTDSVANLSGTIAIGHNRYSTNGDKNEHLQPVVDESIGLAFAHNGNLPDTTLLEKKLEKHNIITNRLNDSEMMARIIATQLRKGLNIIESIEKVYGLFCGAFSCVVLHKGKMIVFRDRNGIRPLSYGSLPNDGWIVASETCALDAVGAKFIDDIKPGEMLVFEDGSQPKTIRLSEGEEKLDIFEFVYFARPDSIMYGERISEVRRRFGKELANEHKSKIPGDSIVVPVPDTSIPAAEGFAEALNLRTRQAIVKDRYIGRTFILPDQKGRERQLNIKHNVIPEAIKGKRVILIDDSIVRLNTLPKIVEKLHSAGARSIFVLIASPPVRFPDFYGMDTPTQDELAASYMTIEEMRKKINSDYLGFLPLERMVSASKNSINKFNLSSFNGEYPVSIGKWQKNIKSPVEMTYVN